MLASFSLHRPDQRGVCQAGGRRSDCYKTSPVVAEYGGLMRGRPVIVLGTTGGLRGLCAWPSAAGSGGQADSHERVHSCPFQRDWQRAAANGCFTIYPFPAGARNQRIFLEQMILPTYGASSRLI